MSSKKKNSELDQIQKEIAKIRSRRDKLYMALEGLKDREIQLALNHLPIQQLTYVAGLLKQQAAINSRLNELALARQVCSLYSIKILTCSRIGCELTALTYVPEGETTRMVMDEYALVGWECVPEELILCPEHVQDRYAGKTSEDLYVRKN